MRIGIIDGGGASLVTAWLLEENLDVTLYEKEVRLGGHAHTIPLGVDTIELRSWGRVARSERTFVL